MGCTASSQQHAIHGTSKMCVIDDSIHAMLERDRKLAQKYGREMTGYKPRAPHPLLLQTNPRMIAATEDNEDDLVFATSAATTRVIDNDNGKKDEHSNSYATALEETASEGSFAAVTARRGDRGEPAGGDRQRWPLRTKHHRDAADALDAPGLGDRQRGHPVPSSAADGAASARNNR